MGAGNGDRFSLESLQQALPQYELLEMLGRGGMGVVYKARQRSLKRLVAIKFLPRDGTDDEFQFVERFRNEAQTMAAMNHPAIVSVYDFGETPDGLLYFVMEFVDGTDVQKMIQAEGRLTADYALAIAAHVCDALGYAHQRGVIHRDIKPANVLINQDGQVKVADFGLAKMHDPAATSGLTQTNMTMGTPDFLAPEALISAQNADHRADLYAVGVMLYQMLTGEVPRGMFKLPSQKGMGTDPRFDAIIVRAMEANRDERYQSAIEVRAALDEILTTPLAKVEGTGAVSISPRPVPAGAVLARRPEKMSLASGKAKWLLAAVTVAVVGGVGLVVMKRSPEPAARPGAPANAPLATESEQAEFLARVEKEPAERQVELVQEKLTALNPEKFTLRPSFKDGRLATLVVHGEVPPGESPQLWPLAAFRRLDGLQIYTKRIADVSWLRGMKVNLLTLPNGTFTDLSVLKDLPLTHLDLGSGPKRDYTALAGKPLQRLRLTGCPVSDLSFIAGMPLTELFIDGTGLTDLSPIRSLPLKDITGDFVPTRDAAILRSIPTLTKINGRPAAEFWANTPQTPQPGWTDWLGPKLAGGGYSGDGWVRLPGGLTTEREINGIRLLPPGTKDAAVRVTYVLRDSQGLMLNARERMEGKVRLAYSALDKVTKLHLDRLKPDGRNAALQHVILPEEVDREAERTLELRLVGNQLTATLNGAFVGTATDDTLSEGEWTLVFMKGVLVKKVEVQPLDAAR